MTAQWGMTPPTSACPKRLWLSPPLFPRLPCAHARVVQQPRRAHALQRHLGHRSRGAIVHQPARLELELELWGVRRCEGFQTWSGSGGARPLPSLRAASRWHPQAQPGLRRGTDGVAGANRRWDVGRGLGACRRRESPAAGKEQNTTTQSPVVPHPTHTKQHKVHTTEPVGHVPHVDAATTRAPPQVVAVRHNTHTHTHTHIHTHTHTHTHTRNTSQPRT